MENHSTCKNSSSFCSCNVYENHLHKDDYFVVLYVLGAVFVPLLLAVPMPVLFLGTISSWDGRRGLTSSSSRPLVKGWSAISLLLRAELQIRLRAGALLIVQTPPHHQLFPLFGAWAGGIGILM
jgi:hypothetical protein